MSTPLWLGPVLAMLAVTVLAAHWSPTSPTRRLDADPSRRRPRPRWPWHRRRPAVTDLEMAEWCEHVARSVRGGNSLTRAIDEAAVVAVRAAGAIEPVRHAVRRGRSLTDALAELSPDASSPLGLVVPVLASCAELGGPAAAPLDRVAETLQGRAAERAERATNSAQAQMSARVLTTLPVGMLALLALAEPSVRTSIGTPAGIVCVVVGGLCNLGGWRWMRRITGGVRP